jgi:hypothetical protein
VRLLGDVAWEDAEMAVSIRHSGYCAFGGCRWRIQWATAGGDGFVSLVSFCSKMRIVSLSFIPE